MHAMMTEKMLALKAGEVIDFQGIALVKAEGPLESGDLYIAGRNGEPQLFTCRYIRYVQNDGSLGDSPDTGTNFGYVYPTGIGYPYNNYECVKVREATDKG